MVHGGKTNRHASNSTVGDSSSDTASATQVVVSSISKFQAATLGQPTSTNRALMDVDTSLAPQEITLKPTSGASGSPVTSTSLPKPERANKEPAKATQTMHPPSTTSNRSGLKAAPARVATGPTKNACL